MNILFTSVGRRGELIKCFKKSLDADSKIIATDCSRYAPAMYLADKQYLVPKIDDPNYLNMLLDICRKEKINAVTTFIDPEIELLAKNREKFEALGVEVLAPYIEKRGVEWVLNNHETQELVDDYIFVDNPFKAKEYLTAIFGD
jgi:carbamoyl-phosphate synthase large subunit